MYNPNAHENIKTFAINKDNPHLNRPNPSLTCIIPPPSGRNPWLSFPALNTCKGVGQSPLQPFQSPLRLHHTLSKWPKPLFRLFCRPFRPQHPCLHNPKYQLAQNRDLLTVPDRVISNRRMTWLARRFLLAAPSCHFRSDMRARGKGDGVQRRE